MSKNPQKITPASRLPGFQKVQKAFTENIRDPENTTTPGGVEERRMAIYRELVYNNIEDLLSNFFPVLHGILPTERWHEIIREFIKLHRSKTPIFMELAKEFVDFLQQGFSTEESDPPFLSELAHYEWIEIALHTSAKNINLDNIDINGDLLLNIPVLNPLIHAESYHYPVHKVSPDYIPDGPQPAFLLVYRDKTDEVQFMELNPMSAHLLNMLIANTESNEIKYSGRQLLEQIAEHMQYPNTDTIINGGLEIMQQWHQRDILLGTLSRTGYEITSPKL